MEKFLIGALVGGIAGALAVSNNAKMRMLVKKGEDELKEKVSTMVDEKLSAMLKKCDETKNAAAGTQSGAEKTGAAGQEQSAQDEAQGAQDDGEGKKKSKKKETKKS